jgi:predicted dehydrogenase
MALTVAEAQRMADACEANGVLLQIAFVRHFCNEWLKLREIVQSGMIGRPVVWRSVSAGSGPASAWFLSKELGGGPFIDGAVHNYDFARFTFGDAIRVSANLRTMKSDSDAWDTGNAVVDFEDGDQLIMCWSWGLPSGEDRTSGDSAHDVLGPEGAILFAGEGKLSVRTKGEEELVEFEPDTGSDWFRRQMAHFVECVQSGETPSVGAREGVEATRIAEAILNIGDSPAVVDL